MNPQISKLVKITGGNRKQNAAMSKVLNHHPAFRQAVERIFAIRKLPKSEAEAAGLSCQSKADPVAISKLFDGVKPYEPMKTDTPASVKQHLESRGWRKYQGGYGHEREYWCKQYKDAPRCKCNDDKEGVQVVIKVYEFEDRESYEIEICGQKGDDAWVKIQCYSWDGALIEVMDDQIRQLLAAWALLAKNKTKNAPPLPMERSCEPDSTC